MSLGSYLRAAPKAELHVHLEGTVQPATLLALAGRNGVALPCTTLDELRAWFRFRDFGHFLEVYGAISRCLQHADDFELIASELAQSLASQHVRYAEVGFSPGFFTRAGIPPAVYLDGLGRARARARRELGVELAWIFDLGRAWHGGETQTRRWAGFTVDLAIEARNEGVVALGLGGPEAGHPPEPFADLFARGRAAGLHSAPHAGEHAGPPSVRGALEALCAERIAHGVRASEDPDVVAELARRRVVLDVCPTSNVRLGVYPDLAHHPLPRLLAAGVRLTINSDDPPLFGTSLNDEVALLDEPFHLELATIDAMLLEAVRASFEPEPARGAREAQHRAELDALKRVHLSE